MSGQCGKCVKKLSSDEVEAKCVECKLSFHPACTRAGSVQNFTKSKQKSWKCDSCVKDVPSVSSNEDTEDKKSILEALSSLKSEILSSLDSKISTVHVSITDLGKQFATLNNKVSAVEEGQAELKRKCDWLEQENYNLGEVVCDLQTRLRDSEQHSRCANIEVQGLPVTRGEDIYQVLSAVAKAIKVPFNRDHISIAHRLRVFSKKHSHPPVIVQFTSRTVKGEWLTAARTTKGLNAKDVSTTLQSSAVFINEQLTSHNKQLLGMARRLHREKKLHYAAYNNGKVRVKKTDKDDAVRVFSIQDLEVYDK